jgi:predicted regulator of Ras-like GTPase activity (Roadblock/LC7/MglB family)
MKTNIRIIFSGSPKMQVQAMKKLLSSGKEQVRLVKEIGASARVLYDAKYEYLDITNGQIAPLLEESFVVFLIKDRESINSLERLIRSKAVESAIDFIIITTPDLAMRIHAGMRDLQIADKVVTYTDPMSSQVAYSTIQLLAANSSQPSDSVEHPLETAAPVLDTAPAVMSESEPDVAAKVVTDLQPEPVQAKANPAQTISMLMEIEGALRACLVDGTTGMILAKSAGSSVNLEIAAAGNTEMLRAKSKTMKALGLKESIEEVLISLESEFHILRPTKARPSVFLYAAFDKASSNLGLARIKLADADNDLAF